MATGSNYAFFITWTNDSSHTGIVVRTWSFFAVRLCNKYLIWMILTTNIWKRWQLINVNFLTHVVHGSCWCCVGWYNFNSGSTLSSILVLCYINARPHKVLNSELETRDRVNCFYYGSRGLTSFIISEQPWEFDINKVLSIWWLYHKNEFAIQKWHKIRPEWVIKTWHFRIQNKNVLM